MKKKEIVDRLKNTQYITSTDDSDGIAIRAGIGDSVSPEEMEEAIKEAEDRIMAVVDENEQTMLDHINNETIHVSASDRSRWDEKIDIEGVIGEELIFINNK